VVVYDGVNIEHLEGIFVVAIIKRLGGEEL